MRTMTTSISPLQPSASPRLCATFSPAPRTAEIPTHHPMHLRQNATECDILAKRNFSPARPERAQRVEAACPERAQRVEAACPERAQRVEAACPERAQRVEAAHLNSREIPDRARSPPRLLSSTLRPHTITPNAPALLRRCFPLPLPAAPQRLRSPPKPGRALSTQ